MALPQEGDPLRPLHLAIRSTRLLGVLFILLGLITPLPSLRIVGSVFELPSAVVASALTHLLPGVLYLICSVLLRRLQRTALISAIGLVAVHCTMLAGSLAAYSGLLVAQTQSPHFLVFALLVTLLAMAGLGQLFYHLVKSFKAIRPPAKLTEEDGEYPEDDSVIPVA